jgi:hypothetical protein
MGFDGRVFVEVGLETKTPTERRGIEELREPVGSSVRSTFAGVPLVKIFMPCTGVFEQAAESLTTDDVRLDRCPFWRKSGKSRGFLFPHRDGVGYTRSASATMDPHRTKSIWTGTPAWPTEPKVRKRIQVRAFRR